MSVTVFNDGAWNRVDIIQFDPNDLDQDLSTVGKPEVRAWLPEANWLIDTQRRGKLLPYIYLPVTMGVKFVTATSSRLGITESVRNTDPNTEIDFSNEGPVLIDEDNDVAVSEVDMVWTSRGT